MIYRYIYTHRFLSFDPLNYTLVSLKMRGSFSSENLCIAVSSFILDKRG